MRLKKIQVAGFKSFVDPLSITVPADVIGIVGPNGCGKSNVIDAVRWVMGEASAKNLRGDSMMDVIFNGSSARKPVGKASVELVFDNTAGKAPGTYAQFAEISIRRTLSRDGQSEYFLNKTRCRRRDITDIFLGTGLGPRSYSIIEQGMVSRIIEAKPEDLRNFIEEAAGVSKYKERRRETETRIRHTRENLSRVEDIRNELGTQLRRLKRQSAAAKRYKVLRQEERDLKVQLLSLRWRGLNEQVIRHDGILVKKETELESKLANQREVESQMEQLRRSQGEAQEQLNKVQEEYYGAGANIASVEQKIEHVRETRLRQQQELTRLQESLVTTEKQLSSDSDLLQVTKVALEDSQPNLLSCNQVYADANQKLESAEAAVGNWQETWDKFGNAAAEPETEREIQNTRIQELERHTERLEERQQRLQSESAALRLELEQSDAADLRIGVEKVDQNHLALETAIEAIETAIGDTRRLIEEGSSEIELLRGQREEKAGRLATLEEIQQSALGNHGEELANWLAQNDLQGREKLASMIKVEEGWELAVDTVLAEKLNALCVDDISPLMVNTEHILGSGLNLMQLGSPRQLGKRLNADCLLDKVNCGEVDITTLLSGIYVAETLTQALDIQAQLNESERVITRAGIQLGSNWGSLAKKSGAEAGVLERSREIERLSAQIKELEFMLEEADQRHQLHLERLAEQEEQRSDKRREITRLGNDRTELHNQLGRKESRINQMNERLQQIETELIEIGQQIEQDNLDLQKAKEKLAIASDLSSSLSERRTQLLDERERLNTVVGTAREQVTETREARHQADLEQQRMRSAVESISQSISRLESQLEENKSRKLELERLLAEEDRPEIELKKTLEELLAKRVEVEARLSVCRDQVSKLEEEFNGFDEQRAQHEQSVLEVREKVDQERLARQEMLVRRDTLNEQLSSEEQQPETVLAELPEDANEDVWEENLDKISIKIERIGPVNLVAIEEFEEQSERKLYLDKQNEDLSQALATLEEVIRKIDRETRTLFSDTFEAINKGFQEFFPKLFGGGRSYLELTGDDLLSAGVTVMARPPGKRNSTIHLLSGGEKALTAVALLFALFDLNPAPFCLLDEVDAPMDDANVERYCTTLKSLASRTQLIFITHNKITMETADILIGVTMSEPGVSRLVDVNIEQAMEMAVQ
ncbi:chromosome segregation protein SMC [Pseudomonadota bacterium]